ncbi:11796_t:CDS:10 [Funneliformis mosseae]|uniref:11796_t:CDS:1 n=1 Tax=Funneliformis mosseae TaxID=27381 RepID=A0A9N9EGS6_FUNMO|nr:11796_t:CDS:10 [Funneliformis mosseae]
MSTTYEISEEAVPDVPLVFVSNQYLDELTSNIRSRPIPWDGYQKATLITQEELDLLKKVDKQSLEQLKVVMQKDAEKYADLYTNLLEKLSRIDTVQYILVLVSEMLSDEEQRVQYFHKVSEKDAELPFRIFLKLLNTEDEFVSLMSAKILTLLIVSAPKSLPFDLEEFYRWITLKLKSNNPNVCDLAVQILDSILRVPSYRAIKEKIIRVIIGTFKNLVDKAPEANLPAMLVARLLNFCENLSSRKWSDNEIVEDIEFLKDQLQENFHSLSTFDEYASEISSGMLQWSPPHESDQFWKQNVTKLNDKDYELLRILARMLSQSSDNVVLAIAAHDLGQYVKYYPSGKKFLQEIGAKRRIMELMTHDDPEVRYRALIAVQKYMTHAW